MKTMKFSQWTAYLFTFRKNILLCLFWGGILAVIVVVNAIGTIKAGINLQIFATSINNNSGLVALFGKGFQLGSLDGYVAWKTIGIASIILAIWGFITASRLFRGDEEMGRIEMLAAGKATLRSITRDTFLSIYTCIGITFFICFLIIAIFCNTNGVHFSVIGSALLSFAFVASSLVLVSITSFIGQLFATRQRVLMYAAIVYGIMFVGRMVADASSSFSWLNNINPLGWIENIQANTGNYVIWVIPLVGLSLVFTVLSIYLSGKRDIAAGLVKTKTDVKSSLFMLSNPLVFSIRQQSVHMLSWAIGVGIFGFVTAPLVNAGAQVVSSSSKIAKLADHINAQVTGNGVGAFLGFIFLLVMVMICFIAINRVGRLREDEAQSYLDNIFVRKVGRIPWMFIYICIVSVEIFFVGFVAGIALWSGSLSVQHTINFGSFMLASVNAVAPAFFILGIGFALFGLFPRVALALQYVVLGWSMIIDLIGPSINLDRHILDTSLFYHIALAPAVNPNWDVVIVLFVVGILGCFIGTFAFNLRDLISE